MRIIERFHPFTVGEAVLFDKWDGTRNRPLTLTPAVVVRVSGDRVDHTPAGHAFHIRGERVTIWPLGGGRTRTARAHYLAHAGWCATCEMPAHQGGAGLFCPRCERRADPVPPPDSWVLRHYPDDNVHHPRIVRRAVLAPTKTRTQIHEEMGAADLAAVEATLTRHGLWTDWYYCYQRRTPFADTLVRAQLWPLAVLGDDAAFLSACHRLGVTLPGERPSPLATMLDRLFRDELDELPAPALPPALRALPLDDREPDASGEAPAWLREALRRAA